MSQQYVINEATFIRALASLPAEARERMLARFRACENNDERFALLRECKGGKLVQSLDRK